MGATFRTIAATGRLVVGRPRVIAAVLVTSVLFSPFALLAGVVPYVGGLLYAFLLHPLLLGGLLHVSDAAVDEAVGIGDFLAGARANYSELVGAFVVVGLVFSVLGVLGAMAAFAAGLTTAVGYTIVAALLAVPVAVLGIGFQFVDAAVVVDGDGINAAVERSWEAAVHHPVSAVGYTVVRLLSLGLLAVALVVLLGGSDLVVASDGGSVVEALVVGVVLGAVGFFGGGVFHALFYRQVSSADQ